MFSSGLSTEEDGESTNIADGENQIKRMLTVPSAQKRKAHKKHNTKAKSDGAATKIEALNERENSVVEVVVSGEEEKPFSPDSSSSPEKEESSEAEEPVEKKFKQCSLLSAKDEKEEGEDKMADEHSGDMVYLEDKPLNISDMAGQYEHYDARKDFDDEPFDDVDDNIADKRFKFWMEMILETTRYDNEQRYATLRHKFRSDLFNRNYEYALRSVDREKEEKELQREIQGVREYFLQRSANINEDKERGFKIVQENRQKALEKIAKQYDVDLDSLPYIPNSLLVYKTDSDEYRQRVKYVYELEHEARAGLRKDRADIEKNAKIVQKEREDELTAELIKNRDSTSSTTETKTMHAKSINKASDERKEQEALGRIERLNAIEQQLATVDGESQISLIKLGLRRVLKRDRRDKKEVDLTRKEDDDVDIARTMVKNAHRFMPGATYVAEPPRDSSAPQSFLAGFSRNKPKGDRHEKNRDFGRRGSIYGEGEGGLSRSQKKTEYGGRDSRKKMTSYSGRKKSGRRGRDDSDDDDEILYDAGTGDTGSPPRSEISSYNSRSSKESGSRGGRKAMEHSYEKSESRRGREDFEDTRRQQRALEIWEGGDSGSTRRREDYGSPRRSEDTDLLGSFKSLSGPSRKDEKDEEVWYPMRPSRDEEDRRYESSPRQTPYTIRDDRETTYRKSVDRQESGLRPRETSGSGSEYGRQSSSRKKSDYDGNGGESYEKVRELLKDSIGDDKERFSKFSSGAVERVINRIITPNGLKNIIYSKL